MTSPVCSIEKWNNMKHELLWISVSNLEWDVYWFVIKPFPVINPRNRILKSDHCESHIHGNIIHCTLADWKVYVRRLHPLCAPSGWGLWEMTATELQTCLPFNHPQDKDFLISPSPVWVSADRKWLQAFVHAHNIFPKHNSWSSGPTLDDRQRLLYSQSVDLISCVWYSLS